MKLTEAQLKALIKEELTKTEITKKVMKKLYKDLSFHHPYIIDRIKV
jgi:predicted translin family RNA/ssDNA-binding protein